MNRLATYAALLLSSCSLGLERDPPVQARFLLDVHRPAGEATGAPTGARLEVRSFHAASAFASARFVYRTEADRWDTDFYREFLVRPELSIADAIRTWLTAAAIAEAVVAPGTQAEPTHVLEGDVVALYGDFRDRDTPRAVIELRVTLLDVPGGRAIRQWQYGEEEALATPEPDLLPAAWNTALGRVLTRLETDLRAAL